jgi:uncharacterized damage-inducible protein DinB
MSQPTGMSAEVALGYRAIMVDGFRREIETTKKVITAVPDAKSSFKHEPSGRSAWELAWHLANTDVQFINGIGDLNFKMENPAQKPSDIAGIVAWYDKNAREGLARVEALSAEQLTTPIAFMGVFNLPAVLYLGFLNNHSIHHRGELATYLRPMGSKVPSIYGGSYDEPLQRPEPASDETAA